MNFRFDELTAHEYRLLTQAQAGDVTSKVLFVVARAALDCKEQASEARLWLLSWSHINRLYNLAAVACRDSTIAAMNRVQEECADWELPSPREDEPIN
jgi:hypothetical protein